VAEFKCMSAEDVSILRRDMTALAERHTSLYKLTEEREREIKEKAQLGGRLEKKKKPTDKGGVEICGYVAAKPPCRHRVKDGGLCGHHLGKKSASPRSD
jgi:hypothetical protein